MNTIYKTLTFLFLMSVTASFAQGGASSCAQLQANFQPYQSCATNIPFDNSINNPSGENFDTSCIFEPFHGPTWFFMKIKNSGSINLLISQVNNAGNETDVDFVLWGPFSNLDNVCGNLTQANEVDCSWSDAGIEPVFLPNGIEGELYILLVDNYSNVPGKITITQTGGTGSSDCSFLSSVEIKDTAGNEITQMNYCKPGTKDIMAVVDTSDFAGNVTDLRFNYKWYKNGIVIFTFTDQVLSTNTITVNDTGVYKIEMSAYDSTDPTVNPANLPVTDDEITLTFYTPANIILQTSTSPCLNDNPVLQVIDNNPDVQVYTYEWFRNNTLIPGAASNTFTPFQPGDYRVDVSNAGCPAVASNTVSIYQNPKVEISDNQTICEEDSYQVSSLITNAAQITNPTYQWFKDAVLIPGATGTTYMVSDTNQAVNTTSVYFLQVMEQGICVGISNNVNIKINPKPALNTTPVPLQQCDYITPNNDGIAISNLTEAYDSITNGNNLLTLSYFLDPALTQPIADPAAFTNTIPFGQNIYVTGIYAGQVPVCNSNVATIALTINPTSVATYPDIAPVCPELNTNFGLIDFNAQRALIKNNYFPTSDVTIDFYINDFDASVEQNPLTNASPIPAGQFNIYTRIETGNNCEGIGSFQIEIYAAPIQNPISNINACKSETILLATKDAEALAGQDASVQSSYFYTFDAAKNDTGAISKNTPLNLPHGITTIFVRLYDSTTQCFSIVKFDIHIYPNPVIIAPDPISLCGDTTAVFDLDIRTFQIVGGNTNYQVTFYETQADLDAENPIPDSSAYTSPNRTILVKAVDPTNNNCSSTTLLALNVLNIPGAINNPNRLQACSADGFYSFDLTQRESQMAGATPLSNIEFKYYVDFTDAGNNSNNTITTPTSFTNTIPDYQRIYVRLNSKSNFESETGSACFRILEQELYIRPYPENLLEEIPYKICIDINNTVVSPAIVDAGLPETEYSFVWFNGFGAIPGNEITGSGGSVFSTPTEGEYSVRITNFTETTLCSTVADFTTRNTLIPFSIESNPTELVAFEVDNTITAIATPASPDYEYMLNGSGWQESNIFYNVREGVYDLIVRNKFGCGEISTKVAVVDYPRFFTPNNDSYNDTWNIGRVALQVSNIYIFDKYGKLITEIAKDQDGWDGTFNGMPMPSDDYWFRINFVTNGIAKEFRSHFTLKR